MFIDRWFRRKRDRSARGTEAAAAGAATGRHRLSAAMLAKAQDMTRSGIGKYRTRGVGGAPDTAFIKDRSISFDIGERLYRERGYAPAFDDLPWAGPTPAAGLREDEQAGQELKGG